jgi:hypothetical protein
MGRGKKEKRGEKKGAREDAKTRRGRRGKEGEADVGARSSERGRGGGNSERLFRRRG